MIPSSRRHINHVKQAHKKIFEEIKIKDQMLLRQKEERLDGSTMWDKPCNTKLKDKREREMLR